MEDKWLAETLVDIAGKTKEPVKPLIDRVKEMFTPTTKDQAPWKTAGIGIRG